MADMVKRFNTPDCESGMHEFEPRYPPQYEINSLALRPNFFCLKVILSLLLTFLGGVNYIIEDKKKMKGILIKALTYLYLIC